MPILAKKSTMATLEQICQNLDPPSKINYFKDNLLTIKATFTIPTLMENLKNTNKPTI